MFEKNEHFDTEKSPLKYECNFCAFKCFRKRDFDRHLLTLKHFKNSNKKAQKAPDPINVQNPKITPKTDANFCTKCKFCGKEYKSRSGRWSHEKKCSLNIPNIQSNNTSTDIESKIDALTNAMTIQANAIAVQADAMRSNHVAQVEQNKVLTNTITIIADKVGNTTNNTNSHNTNNNQFNINLFLNEQCKDAISMQEFVKNITVELDDLKYTVKNGTVDGITNIIVRNLNELQLEERPVHCTDVKRGTLYVKDEEDGWGKSDIKSKQNIQHMVKVASSKYGKLIKTWTDKQPTDWMDHPTICDEFHAYVQTIRLCADGEKKVIKNVSKEIIVDKGSLLD